MYIFHNYNTRVTIVRETFRGLNTRQILSVLRENKGSLYGLRRMIDIEDKLVGSKYVLQQSHSISVDGMGFLPLISMSNNIRNSLVMSAKFKLFV